MNEALADLLTFLTYDPASGFLTWTASPTNVVKVGDRAGGLHKDGYRYVRFRERRYLAHRLCWTLHFGQPPTLPIDHENMNKDDNWISNLRLATVAENNRNREKQSNNTSGFKGVTLHKGTGKFNAKITRDKKPKSLGYFDTCPASGGSIPSGGQGDAQ